MNSMYFSTLFAYNAWANRKVVAAAAGLEPALLLAPADLSHGSILGALVHVYAAEVVWRARCQFGQSPARLPMEGDFSALGELAAVWLPEADAFAGYVGQLAASAFDEDIAYTNTKGVVFSTPLWQVLAHVVNHGTQFRTEAAVALSRHGCSPGDLDLIAYLRSGDRA